MVGRSNRDASEISKDLSKDERPPAMARPSVLFITKQKPYKRGYAVSNRNGFSKSLRNPEHSRARRSTPEPGEACTWSVIACFNRCVRQIFFVFASQFILVDEHFFSTFKKNEMKDALLQNFAKLT